MINHSIQVILPMAGLGSRFVMEGYTVPKPLLPIHGQPMFALVLDNLLTKQVCNLTIVTQKEWGLSSKLRALEDRVDLTINVIEIDYLTGGPACTVELAEKYLDMNLPVVTGNSDQYVDADLTAFFAQVARSEFDGNILTMMDDDPKWSYVMIDANDRVIDVREKQVISNIATVGIYGFKSGETMLTAIESMKRRGKSVNGEYYVAPAYNEIIASGGQVGHTNLGPVSDVMHGLGIPVDYESFLEADVSVGAAERASRLGF